MQGPPLTPRERAVLAAVERRLSNPEIAAELFISVRTVESHIAALRRKLTVDSRVDLARAAKDLRETSVRVPANPLRGRGRDLSDVRRMLDANRRVTIVGPGGVGKTRLALELARSDAGRAPLVVELEHAEPGDVVARIARTVGLEATPAGGLTEAVLVSLASQPYTLVLDNADRVGPATAEVVKLLLAHDGTLVIVTSRTPLGDADEVVHPLLPLATDGVDSPAGALLADRMRASGRPVAPADQPIAGRIATRLDGLPLALELAASVARHLPLADLDARLERDLAALDRAAPLGRHRTLDTAFEWTWDLLDAGEQDVLRRLAALPRTFDLDLAVAVTRPGAEGVVLRLLDHSLIVATGSTPVRFRLLAVMREFVHARTDPALIREVLQRHAEFVTDVAVGFIAQARTDASAEAGLKSKILCPEVNAALRWSVAARHPTALRLAAALSVGVEQYGLDVDSVNALAEVARDDAILQDARPAQLLLLGTALAFFDLEAVTALAVRALSIADGDEERGHAHQLAGHAAAYRGDLDVALRHLDVAERLASTADDAWGLGAIRQTRGIALRAAGSTDAAAVLDTFASAMRAYARAGDATHVNNARYMMASVAAEDDYDRDLAERLAAECRAHAEASFNEHEVAHARLVQARLGLAAAGDLADLAVEFRRLGDLRCVNRTLLLRADAVTDPHERVALLAEALAIATAAADTPRQRSALEQLVAAYHDAADTASALATLDRLGVLAGRDAAEAVCPPDLRDAFAPERTTS